ncbi:MAG: hypothetical protein ABI194_00890 [Gemmatimonadaceae bacterium]
MSSGIRTYTITAHDYAYTDLPLHAPSGWLTLRLVNAGTELHMLGVLRVPHGVSPASVVDSVTRMHVPANVTSAPGVNDLSPNDTGTVSGYFAPGDYVAACFIRSADGSYHVMKGMAGTFDVVASSDTGTHGPVDAFVTVSDQGLRFSPATLRRGMRTVRVASDSGAGADVALVKLRPGRSANDALRWLSHSATVAPAATALGGASGSILGQVIDVTADFTPGRYLFVLQPFDAKPGATPAYRALTVR